MPERGRHHQRDEVYSDYNSGDHFRRGDLQYNGQSRNQKPRHMKELSSADDERVSGNKHREINRTSHEQVGSYRYHDHEVPSTLNKGRFEYHSERDPYEQQHKPSLYNLRYSLTGRGLCQLLEVFVNLLIIICAGVPYSNKGGYRDLASLGGVYAYYFGGANAFTGADAERVKELDTLFHQLKRPPYVFTMACGGILMFYSCVMFALGIFRIPYRWPPVLLGEALLNFLIGLGYIPGIAFYFIKIQEIYDNPICKEREQMYKSKGHKGFDCKLDGADITGGVFGVLGVFVFIFGGVLAVRAFRFVRNHKKQNTDKDNHF